MDSGEPKLEAIVKFYLDHQTNETQSTSPSAQHSSIITFRSNDSSTYASTTTSSLDTFSDSQTESDVNDDSTTKDDGSSKLKRKRVKSKNEEMNYPSTKRAKND